MSKTPGGHSVGKPGVTLCLLGDSGVGKTSLTDRFSRDTFTEVYYATRYSETEFPHVVSGQILDLKLLDTCGDISSQDYAATSLCSHAILAADLVLLCYSISEPTSLFSATTFWLPLVKSTAPYTPIMMIGCKADLRQDWGSPRQVVTVEQALTASHQANALMYVECSAKTSSRSVDSVIEMAVLTTLGTPDIITSHHISKRRQQRSKSTPRLSDREDGVSHLQSITPRETGKEYPVQRYWNKQEVNGNNTLADYRSGISKSRRTPSSSGSISSGSFRSQSSNRSTSRTDSSYSPVFNSINDRNKTRLRTIVSPSKENTKRNQSIKTREGRCSEVDGKMVTIKCQRLTEEKEYEEVEIEVPVSVYQSMHGDEVSETTPTKLKERRARMGSKLNCLFSKTDQ